MNLYNCIVKAHHPVTFKHLFRQKLFQAFLSASVYSNVYEFPDYSLGKLRCAGIDGKNFADKFRNTAAFENLELRVRERWDYMPVAQLPVNSYTHALAQKAAYLVGEPDDICTASRVGDYCLSFSVPRIQLADSPNRTISSSGH